MSAHVLLNSLNELGRRDKMRGLPNFVFNLNTQSFILISIHSTWVEHITVS